MFMASGLPPDVIKDLTMRFSTPKKSRELHFVSGFYEDDKSSIVVNKDRPSISDIIDTALHEAGHRASYVAGDLEKSGVITPDMITSRLFVPQEAQAEFFSRRSPLHSTGFQFIDKVGEPLSEKRLPSMEAIRDAFTDRHRGMSSDRLF